MSANTPPDKNQPDWLAAMKNNHDEKKETFAAAATETAQKPDARLDALKKRKAQIEQQIKNIEQKNTAQQRKDDTRAKVLIGAAFVADTMKHPETRDLIKAVLNRGIQRDKEREFLKKMGWL